MFNTNKHMTYIRWFREIGINDVPTVGGKNASLGEMVRLLGKKGVPVPDGFAITARSYFALLEHAGIRKEIKHILSDLDTRDLNNLAERGRKVRALILKAEFFPELKSEIINAYDTLAKREQLSNLDVAVRSSATAEDLPDASFAGQQETFLNIRGHEALLEACRKCFASLFTDRAIAYRHDQHFDHFKVGLSIGVQRMVRSDMGASGIMFTIDTETGFRDAVLINAIWGLGENIVQGAVTPDEFFVHKPTLKEGYRSIIKKKIGVKSKKMVYTNEGGKSVKNIETSKEEREQFSLTDDEVLAYAKMAMTIEEHYKRPMDMEWAKDGRTGKLFIVQARPETVQSRKNPLILERYQLKGDGKVLVRGVPVGSKIATGRAHVIRDVKDIQSFKAGEILVTEMTDPDWVPIMKIAAGIITNRGGRTCHAAIISRELDIPCVVGTEGATEILKTGQEVTVSCRGADATVYEGTLPFTVHRTNLKNLKRPQTQILMNIAEPDLAFDHARIPCDGVGWAREEFITANAIGIHPLALIHFDTLTDKKVRRIIEERTRGYKDKKEYYISELARGVGMLAAAFYPKPVIFRFSDFKTNEYANLIGGKEFEPKEDNPMLGWRGAARYYDPDYIAAFQLELEAFRRARTVMGMKNIKLMVPMCRTLEEGKKVLALMAKAGLKRGKDGLDVYVMCELPSNVILAQEFAKLFDGFSIGSNDLTQMTLGVDRDSERVRHIYDERNPAVKALMAEVIKKAHAAKPRAKVGICGQAPSDYPEIARFLVGEGIDSISLNPDAILSTTLAVLDEEKKLKR